MLAYWRTHDEYQLWLKSRLVYLVPEHEAEIRFYGSLIEKVYVLNLDPLKDIIAPMYSPIGRPAHKQPELFRALFVMLHCKTQDPTKFVAILRTSPVLAAICGKLPGLELFMICWPGYGWLMLLKKLLKHRSLKAVSVPNPARNLNPNTLESSKNW